MQRQNTHITYAPLQFNIGRRMMYTNEEKNDEQLMKRMSKKLLKDKCIKSFTSKIVKLHGDTREKGLLWRIRDEFSGASLEHTIGWSNFALAPLAGG